MEKQELLKTLQAYDAATSSERRQLMNGMPTEDVAKMVGYNYSAEVSARNMGRAVVEEETFNVITSWAAGATDKRWLMLMGRPGTGKSTYLSAIRRSACIANEAEIERRNVTVTYCKASRLGAMLKENREEFENVCKSTFLFLDDLGFSGSGELVNNYGIVTNPVAELLETRYDRMAVTVMTTNLNGQQLRDMYGERIYSRLCEMCMVVNFNGKDKRISFKKN